MSKNEDSFEYETRVKKDWEEIMKLNDELHEYTKTKWAIMDSENQSKIDDWNEVYFGKVKQISTKIKDYDKKYLGKE